MKTSHRAFIVLALAVAVLCLAALAGCSSSVSGSYSFDGGKVAIDGKTLTVTLEGNPTTGYEWTDEISGTCFEQDEYSYIDESSTGITSSETHNYEFVYEGVGSGTGTVTFTRTLTGNPTAVDKAVVVNVKTNSNGTFSHVDTVIGGKTCGEANA